MPNFLQIFLTCKMTTRPFKTLEEAVEYLYSEEIESDIYALPPDVDELTDEEDVDDNDLSVPTVTDVAGFLEVNIEASDVEFDSEDDIPLSELAPKPSTSHSAKKRKIQQPTAEWEETAPVYSMCPTGNIAEENLRKLKDTLANLSPIAMFEKTFDDELLDFVVEETTRYATTQKNKHNFSVTREEIKIFIGFLIFSGYHTLPSERDYWSEEEDLGISLVKNAMSRNAYLKIKSVIHFQDNSKVEENKKDKSFKIKPLLEKVNNNFRKWGIFHQNLSIDEMIVRYYGHNTLKQFIRAKPIRFGYKLWAMCGHDGYCYNFSLYCGKEEGTSPTDPLGTRVVTKMLSVVEDPTSHFIYFNNFFSSHGLFLKLRQDKFRATGTIRENRTQKCPIKSAKELEKLGRGAYDFRFDSKNEIMIVKWNDNKCVSLATNFDTILPLSSVQRWNREKKERVAVSQPRAIFNYNKNMGGVDQHDWLLEKYSIAIRGKKWYWCLVTRIIDMAVVNSYLLYKQVQGRNAISLKDFRRQIAVTYLKLGHGVRVMRGRPLSLPSTSGVQSVSHARYDNIGHTLERRDKQRRCQYTDCKRKPLTFCKKCNVTLCRECFFQYHKKP